MAKSIAQWIGRGSAVAVQLGIALVAFGLLAAMPPASGRMIIVAFDGTDAGRLAAMASRSGARVVGAGPLPGMLIVEGERKALGAVVTGAPRLLLAARGGGCEGDVA